MIRLPRLMPPVLGLLDPAHTAVQQPVAPRGTPLLVARVVGICSHVVLVRRREGYGHFLERAQAEAGVLSAGREELVAVEQFGQVLLADSFDDCVAWDRVNAVVQVAVYDADFVVKDHGAVAAADVVIDACGGAGLGGEGVSFHDCGDVVVAVGGLGLAGC